MYWPIKAKNSRRKRKNLQSKDSRRSLRFESLEDRRLLAVDVIWPGTGDFFVLESAQTPGASDQILIEATNNAGEWLISGVDGTQVQLNGAGNNANSQLVNNIFGDVGIDLGTGTNAVTIQNTAATGVAQFPNDLTIVSNGVNDTVLIDGFNPPVTVMGTLTVFNGPGTRTTLDNFSVLGSVVINNDNGNTNSITNSVINGGLWVSKQPAIGAGQSDLNISDSTIVGPTSVTNHDGAGAGGDTSTTIKTSTLLGQTTGVPLTVPGFVPAVPAGMALRVANLAGDDSTRILGETQIGMQTFVSPALVLQISNGNGGSMTELGPIAAGDLTRVDVNGHMTVRNGTNIPNRADVATFFQVDVDGALVVYNDGGPGATNTMISDSNLGTFLAPPGPDLGSPVIIINENGQDNFTMNASTAWWGLFIDHDNDPTAIGAPTPWPSNTQITGSNIGTRPGGPSSQAGLAAALAAAFPAPPVNAFQLPALLSPGDALLVAGGVGNDVINVNPTQIGGTVRILLPGGNNSITLTGAAANPLVYSAVVIVTGSGNDSVLFDNISIPVGLAVLLDGGNDTLEFRGNTTLPAAGVGAIVLDGGAGVDDLIIGDDVVLPLNFFQLIGVITDFNL